MSRFRMTSDLARRAWWTGLILMMSAGAAVSQTQTPPYASLQYSTLTGSGNTITITQLPVVTSTGTTFVDVVVQFDVATDGTLTIAPPTVTQAPRPLIDGFMAGNYVGPSGSDDAMTVSGPGVAAGGATEWTLDATASNCSIPVSATWYVFGGSMTKNPLYERLKAAGITAQVYATYGGWGTTGEQPCDGGSAWQDNTLIGLSQVGNGLAIVSFSQNGVDKAQPVDTISYTKSSQ